MLKLSVLDQVPISEGMEGSEALANSLDLARAADRLGYHRYWIAEHHGLSLGSTSPEVLIGPMADQTERIRLGSGGVMLPHYSPFKVAESFSMLAGLFPDRIDLGIGRASGTDPLTAYALQRDRRTSAPDDFPDQLAELLAYLRGDPPLAADHPFQRLTGNLPGRPQQPEVWLLGSSPQSAIWAAELGLPYSFADFINRNGSSIMADYRHRADSSERDFKPRGNVGAWVVCADTDEEAMRIAASSKMSFLKLREGEAIPVPPIERALEYLGERAFKHSRSRRTIVGSPATVRPQIEELAEEYATDEVIVVTITHSHADRRRTYELLAEEFGLGG